MEMEKKGEWFILPIGDLNVRYKAGLLSAVNERLSKGPMYGENRVILNKDLDDLHTPTEKLSRASQIRMENVAFVIDDVRTNDEGEIEGLITLRPPFDKVENPKFGMRSLVRASPGDFAPTLITWDLVG